MYRVIAIVAAGLLLSACETASTPDWMKVNWDALKPAPRTETVRFESEPPGADARTSTGQTCRTPCSLEMPAGSGFTVTFTLNGYAPDTETVEFTQLGDGTSQLRPNPVLAELTPAPVIPQKPKPAAKPKTKPKPKPAAARTQPAQPAANTGSAPAQQQSSPWPQQPAR
jgi:hypothetical protein